MCILGKYKRSDSIKTLELKKISTILMEWTVTLVPYPHVRYISPSFSSIVTWNPCNELQT